jgi:hypothetical protein
MCSLVSVLYRVGLLLPRATLGHRILRSPSGSNVTQHIVSRVLFVVPVEIAQLRASPPALPKNAGMHADIKLWGASDACTYHLWTTSHTN